MKPRQSALLAALFSALLWNGLAAAEALNLSPAAKVHFKAGVAYVDDPSGSKWEEALKEFRLAYAETPTSKLLNNIGLCALNLERDGEAIEAFKGYLAGGAESDLKAKQRKQIEKDIETLSASLVKISIQTVPDEVTLIDKRENAKGQLVINMYPVKGGTTSLGLHPGRHKITAEAAGYIAGEWTVDADPASSHSHRFELASEKKPEAEPVAPPAEETQTNEAEPPKREAKPSTPTSVYIGLAATGVFAGAATATGLIAMKKSKDLDKITDQAAADDAKGTVKTWALITDIGIGAAVLSAGATAYFYFTAPKASPEKQASVARWQFAPVVTPSVAGGAVFGRF
ncbi:MAG TPA: hypothetical protein VIV60_23320 [Polyangiaceae bacterium]